MIAERRQARTSRLGFERDPRIQTCLFFSTLTSIIIPMASGSASAPIPYALLHGTDETFDQDIDQLASSDDEAEAQSSHDDSVPFPQKRPAGGSYLPMDRLESILQADGIYACTSLVSFT